MGEFVCNWVVFLCGMFLGGIVGVLAMTFLIVGRDD